MIANYIICPSQEPAGVQQGVARPQGEEGERKGISPSLLLISTKFSGEEHGLRTYTGRCVDEVAVMLPTTTTTTTSTVTTTASNLFGGADLMSRKCISLDVVQAGFKNTPREQDPLSDRSQYVTQKAEGRRPIQWYVQDMVSRHTYALLSSHHLTVVSVQLQSRLIKNQALNEMFTRKMEKTNLGKIHSSLKWKISQWTKSQTDKGRRQILLANGLIRGFRHRTKTKVPSLSSVQKLKERKKNLPGSSPCKWFTHSLRQSVSKKVSKWVGWLSYASRGGSSAMNLEESYNRWKLEAHLWFIAEKISQFSRLGYDLLLARGVITDRRRRRRRKPSSSDCCMLNY